LKLERLIPLLATNEWFRHLSKPVQVLDKIRIYEPLLCVYVRHVTGKDDYAALAAIYRAFYYASGKTNKKSEVSQDAPRVADARYREKHCEAYAALEAAVTKYLKDASSAQEPPHYILLVLAHVEIGHLVKHASAESKQVA
jgi:hypothetical protein